MRIRIAQYKSVNIVSNLIRIYGTPLKIRLIGVKRFCRSLT